MSETVRCGVLVISDRCYRKEAVDESGPCLAQLLRSTKHFSANVLPVVCVEDDLRLIQKTVIRFTDVDKVDLLITSGGTGFGVRDCTPEVRIKCSFRLNGSVTLRDFSALISNYYILLHLYTRMLLIKLIQISFCRLSDHFSTVKHTE